MCGQLFSQPPPCTWFQSCRGQTVGVWCWSYWDGFPAFCSSAQLRTLKIKPPVQSKHPWETLLSVYRGCSLAVAARLGGYRAIPQAMLLVLTYTLSWSDLLVPNKVIKGTGFRVGQTWDHSLALALSSLVNLGKFLHVSNVQPPIYKKGMLIIMQHLLHSIGLMTTWDNTRKGFNPKFLNLITITFQARKLFVVWGVLCLTGYLAEFLASTH